MMQRLRVLRSASILWGALLFVGAGCGTDSPSNTNNTNNTNTNQNQNNASGLDGGMPDSTVTACQSPADCDDSNACTTDSCDMGACQYAAVDPDDGDACTTDACDPAAGVSNTPVDPDDGDACTTDACDPATGVSNTPVNPDDGNPCTIDACDPATGVANTPLNPDDGNPCTLDSCDPAQGVRNAPSISLFTETFADNTQGWVLGPEWEIGPATASTGGTIGADPDTDHTPTADNGVAGVVIGGNASTAQHGYYYLESPPINATVPSGYVVLSFWRWLNSDYEPFMRNAVEVFDGMSWQVLWQSGSSPPISDSPPDGGGWVRYVFDVTAHANPALQVRFGFEIASGGVYTAGSWNVDDVEVLNTAQPADDDPCTEDGCDPMLGAVYPPVDADDGNPCTTNTCEPDRAIQHGPVNPDDGNACTLDSCDPSIGIVNTPIDPDDGNLCTTDSCDPTSGVVNDPVVCDDGNACTTDTCDQAAGGCVAGPEQPHDKCTNGDMLQSGCSDQCITDICAADAFCCDNSWDNACIDEVYSVCDSKICPESAGTCAQPLCQIGVALTAGCDAAFGDCVTQVCAADSWCCNNDWDNVCIDQVASVCGLNCN